MRLSEDVRSQSATLAALVVCALVTMAGAAGAADGDPYLKTCFSTAGTERCTALPPPFAAADAELAPGGGHLYVAVSPQGGSGHHGLRLFDVGVGGTLSPRPGAATAMTKAPYDIDFSPDGRTVYVPAGDELVVFQRDASTGLLAQAQCLGPAPCSRITAPNSYTSAAVSPDGRNVYVRGSNQLTVFDRDPGTGVLAQKLGAAGCITEEIPSLPCVSAAGIAGSGHETAVSPDNRHVYVTNEAPGGVAVFTREASGSLAQPPGMSGGCVTAGGSSGAAGGAECASGPPTLARARAVNLDAQGAFAIVSAAAGNTVFRRDAAAGTLSQTDCLDEVGGSPAPSGCHEVKGASGSDAAVTPDGRHVAVNASELGLSSFRLDRASGKLAQRARRGCFSIGASAPCEHVPGLHGGLGGVTFSTDGLALFAAFRGGSVAAFDVDYAPTCRNTAVSVRRNAAVHVPLSCADLNGDAVTLEIAAPPSSGALGIVDQQRKRVSYTPDINFSGRDVFRYRGIARAARAAPATVTINVRASGRRVDRTPPNTRIKGGPPKATSSETARFRFVSSERGSRFECKLDKSPWVRCRSPKRYVGLKRGKHTFQVRAIDRAGNFDLSPARRNWIQEDR
jgi:DNA-binding beta-propeller fold protein YncE